jgi:hypothetical protein
MVHHNTRKTHCPRGHQYTKSNTKRGAKGERLCRACDLALRAIRRLERRLKAIEYLGGTCVDCSYHENFDALEFDHLPQYGPPDRNAIKMTLAWETIRKELDKCELVCANHHAIRTAERRRNA